MKTWQQTLEDIEFEIGQKKNSAQTRIEIDRYLLERGYNPVDIDLVWEKLQKSERPRHWLLHTGRGILTQWAVIGLIVGLVVVIWRPFDRPDYITVTSPEKFNFADVAYSPNGRYLSALDVQGQLFIWQMPERRLLKAYGSSNERHRAAGRISWSTDSQVVLTTSGYAVQVFRLEDNQTIFTELSRNDPPLATLSPDSKYVAITQYPNQVVLYDLATGAEIKKTKNDWKYDVKLNTIKFSPDSKVLAIECMNTIWLWNIETDEDAVIKPTIIKQMSAFSSIVYIKGFNFSPDGQELAVTLSNDYGGTNHETQLWDWRNNNFVVVTERTSGALVDGPVYRLDGERLALLSRASGKKEAIKAELQVIRPALVKTFGSVQPFNITEDVQKVAFSPDNKTVVFISVNKLLLTDVDRLRN
jgi:WD40 repeat protein